MNTKYILFSPHPPIIIPEIGNGMEIKAVKTIEGMKKLAALVDQIQPDVILFITPHGNAFRNGTCLLYEDEIYGDFTMFGNSSISFKKSINKELTSLINENLEKEDFISILLDNKLAKQYNCNVQLDHGVLVPMYYIDKVYSDYEIVHITPGFTSFEENYRIGIGIQKVLKDLDKRCVVIASGDLSHCLSNDGPYEFHRNGKKFDEMVCSSIERKDVLSLVTMNTSFVETAGQCGLRSFLMGLGLSDGFAFESNIISYEGPFGVGYMTGSVKILQEQADSLLNEINLYKEDIRKDYLSQEDDYIKLARMTINHYVKTNKKVTIQSVEDQLDKGFLDRVLQSKAGVFVSLHKDGQLRGCIGTIAPTCNNVAEEIIYNGIHACSKDPRFNPVEENELIDLDIKVDELKDSERISSKSELDVKKYGVIVQQGYKRGLLLPNLEGIDTVDEQIEIAMKKAGIQTKDNIELYRFEVIRHEVK